MPVSMYNRAHTNQITLQELATLLTKEARALRYVGRLPDTRLCSQERTKTQDKHQQRKQQQQNKRKRAEFLCRCIHEKFRPHLRRCTKKKVLLWQKKTQGAHNCKHSDFTHALNERAPYG